MDNLDPGHVGNAEHPITGFSNNHAGISDAFAPIASTGAVLPKAADAEIWEPHLPAPVDLSDAERITHFIHGASLRHWIFRNANGAALFAEVRFDTKKPDGTPDKEVLPYTYGRRQWTTKAGKRLDKTGWHFKRPAVPVPLYGLDRLAARPDADVLLCEGAKSADAAAAIFPDMVSIAALGGSNAPHKSDWSAIAGRKVVIWPDADQPGINCANDAAALIRDAGAAAVRIVPIVPSEWPDGWDLADELPPGSSVERQHELLNAAEAYGVAAEPHEQADPAEPAIDAAATINGTVTSIALEKAFRLSDLEFAAQKKEIAESLNITPADLASLRRKRFAEIREAEKAQKTANDKAAKERAKEAADNAEREARHAKYQAAYDASKPDVEKLIKRFNAEFMIVNEAGKALVYQRGEHAVLNRRVFHRLSISDIKTLYMNERIAAGADAEGNAKMRNVASVWLNHADRRQYIKGVAFDPTNKTPDGVLNLWEGFGTKPVPGDWSLLKDHIKTIVCSKNQEHSDYLMNWLARLVQFPAQQGEVAVVLRGVEGCGKGTLASAVKTMIGHHALGINNPKHLVGNFNQHLRDVVFLFADEAFFAGDKANVGALKSLITESSITIEGKYINATEFPNYLHVMMASNEEWVVPADLRSRRFLVLNVPDTKVNDHPYFEAIRKQLDAGGYAAMLHELLNRDISAFNVRIIPNSEGLEQQRHLSLDTLHAWWLDCLERGYVFRSKIGLEEIFGVWDGDHYSTELLFASYMEFAKARNERRPHNRVQLGKFMVEMNGKVWRKRGSVIGEHIVEDNDASGRLSRRARPVTGVQPSGYGFGGLASAREAFEVKTNITIPWDDGAEDLPPEPKGESPDAAKAAKAAKPANSHLTE